MRDSRDGTSPDIRKNYFNLPTLPTVIPTQTVRDCVNNFCCSSSSFAARRSSPLRLCSRHFPPEIARSNVGRCRGSWRKPRRRRSTTAEVERLCKEYYGRRRRPSWETRHSKGLRREGALAHWFELGEGGRGTTNWTYGRLLSPSHSQ